MRSELQQTQPARRALAGAVRDLQECEERLTSPAPDYASGVRAGVRAIRGSLEGFLTWHGASLPKGAPISELGRRATQLASGLRTPLQRARSLEALAGSLDGRESISINEREAAKMGYFTARNTVRAILVELPDALSTDGQQPR